MTEILIVWSSFATEEDAARVVRVLVDERLIACGPSSPAPARSIAQGRRARRARGRGDDEDAQAGWTRCFPGSIELHPYETPECIAVRVAAGAPRYMAWLESALEAEGGA